MFVFLNGTINLKIILFLNIYACMYTCNINHDLKQVNLSVSWQQNGDNNTDF